MSRFKEGIAAPAFTGPLASPDDANVTVSRTPSVTRSFLPSSKKKVHFVAKSTPVAPWLCPELNGHRMRIFWSHSVRDTARKRSMRDPARPYAVRPGHEQAKHCRWSNFERRPPPMTQKLHELPRARVHFFPQAKKSSFHHDFDLGHTVAAE